MGEKNIKRLYETLARILSKRENVKITVNVSKKEKLKNVLYKQTITDLTQKCNRKMQ